MRVSVVILPLSKSLAAGIEGIRVGLRDYYGGKYETEDCATSFGLFWNPQTNTTIGAGKLIEICQGTGKNKCTGTTSK